jgi:hypothetical protein
MLLPLNFQLRGAVQQIPIRMPHQSDGEKVGTVVELIVHDFRNADLAALCKFSQVYQQTSRLELLDSVEGMTPLGGAVPVPLNEHRLRLPARPDTFCSKKEEFGGRKGAVESGDELLVAGAAAASVAGCRWRS